MPRATFTRMGDGTAQDWRVIGKRVQGGHRVARRGMKGCR